MLARTRWITLRNDIVIHTPLLIPSLSSAATGPIPFQGSPDRHPIMTACSIVHSQSLLGGIDGALLVSAYDIHHDLLDDTGAFKSGFKGSRYAQPKVLVIDSGWYEKAGIPPAGQFSHGVRDPRPWEMENYQSTIDDLDADLRPLVVSWDHIGPYAEQVGLAQDFFGSRMTLASSLLLKPPSADSRFHQFERLSDADAKNLRAFDVIGVTDRELGDTVIERLIAITRLREQLDNLDVETPIHVFGGLDPLYTPLYFAAGAELFDGLGWLRYAYREGVAMNRDAATIFERQINKRWLQALISVSLQNLDQINRLTEDLRQFTHYANWNALDRGTDLKPIFESLQARTGNGGS